MLLSFITFFIYKVGETCKPPEDADNIDSIIYDDEDGPSGTIPTYANSSQAFWQGLDSCEEDYKLEQIVRKIDFWNETSAGWEVIWEVIYFSESTMRGNDSLFDLAIYPFEGTSALVCHTLIDGLAKLGTLLRIRPRIGTKICFFCI
jgi:hypothetical protein